MPKRLDLVGQRFGRLTALSFDRIEKRISFWNCICDCGKKITVNGSSLKLGHTQSCGCLKKEKIHKALFKDLTNKKFGRLTVISFNRIEKKRTFWNCICICGREKIVNGNSLLLGRTKSCGCLRKEMICKNNIYHSRENSPRWLGGTSFEPYCQKWTKELRCRIRAFFNYECVICGKTQKENKKQLSCHHVTYDKMSCCDGKPAHFASLCGSCHSKTNKDRAKWKIMLHRIIDEIYGGKSYFTKEEYKSLKNHTENYIN